MKSIDLQELTEFWNTYLRIAEIKDFSSAFNGLQLENSGKVTKIVAAVDASESIMEEAIALGADLLLVHHGLFWNGSAPWTGRLYRKLKKALAADLAVYSSHLPLDAHPEVGNNIEICRALGIDEASTRPFFEEGGVFIGRRVRLECSREEFIKKIEAVIGGTVHCGPFGPGQVREVGIVSGGCGNALERVAAEGIDTFLTGEGSHWTSPLAEELGVNLIYAGHYATETFGVKALAAMTSQKFGISWQFIDHPTGL